MSRCVPLALNPSAKNGLQCTFMEKLQLVLVVYVDDFKMAGPQKNLAQGWSMLRTRLKIEPETGLDMYLGCNQKQGKRHSWERTPSNNGDL